MTEIYLVRHAKSAPSAGVPEAFWPLSREGREQARVLSGVLQEIAPKALYSSTYPRAVDTLQPLAEKVAMEIHLDHDLRERKLTEEMRDDWLELLTRAWQDFDFALPGCESSRVAQSRMRNSILQIGKKHEGQKVVVASHGNVIGLMLAYCDAGFGFDQWKQLRNPDVYKLTLKDSLLEWDQSWVFEGIG